jgi:hypothetical protein
MLQICLYFVLNIYPNSKSCPTSPFDPPGFP